MPQAAASAAASAYASATVSSFAAAAGVSAGTAAVYAGAYAVTALALTAGLSAASTALMGKPKLPTDTGARRFVVRDSAGPRAILYGETVVSGITIYANQRPESSGSNALDMVLGIAGHEVAEISDVWFNNSRIPYAAINGGAAAGGAVGDYDNTDVTPTKDGHYRPRDGETVARIHKYLGTDTQTADSTLVSAYTTEWSSDHRLRGVAYARITLQRNLKVYEQGAPANYRFKVKGAKVYDPRKDSTNGGTGLHRIADPSTWEYSNNPALCIADYLIGGTITNSATRVNLRGFGADPDDVDWASVITAANICDEDVAIPPASPATTQKRYTCDGVLSSGETCAENLELLLTSMLGQLVYSGGKYRMYAGAYQTPTLTLNETDLAGTVAYATGMSRSERYNAVKGTRWDMKTGQEVEFLPRTSPTYATEDGGDTLYRDITLPFCTDEYRAQRLAQIILRRSREQQQIVWRGNLGCLRVGVWETVAVTVAELGITSKAFRCISRTVTMDGDDAIVELTLREENSSTYTDPLVADYDDLTPADPQDPGDDALAAPTALTATGVQGGISFAITAPEAEIGTDAVYDIAEYTASTPSSSATVIWSGTATTVIIPKSDQTTRYYWTRSRRNNVMSAYYPSTTGVSGTALPPAEDGTDGATGPTGPTGPSGLTVSLSNKNYSILCDSAGVPVSGAFDNATGQVTVYSGTTDVTSSATYSSSATSVTGSVNTATNTPVTGAKGSYRITAMSADTGYLAITATYNTIAVTERFNVVKVRAGAASSSATDTTFNNLTLTSYPTTTESGESGGVLTIAIGPNGTVSVSYELSISRGTSPGGVTGTVKVQYRESGTTTWTDVTSSEQSDSTNYDGESGEWVPGYVTVSNLSITEPSTQSLYQFRLIGYSSSGTYAVVLNGVFSVSWSP